MKKKLTVLFLISLFTVGMVAAEGEQVILPEDSSGLFATDWSSNGELNEHNFDDSSFTEDDVGTPIEEIDLENADTSNVKNMDEMFYHADGISNHDITDWDTSNVESMDEMFFENDFNQDISNWDTSNVESMHGTFQRADEFNQDISNWDVSNVTDMSDMFGRTDSFNQDLNDWDTSNVQDMSHTFDQAHNFSGDISEWDTSNVEDFGRMFWNSESFNGDISGWDMSSAKDISGMFQGSEEFNRDISGWDTSNVEDMSTVFMQAESFNQDVSNWDTSNVESMNSMFFLAVEFNQDLSNWDVSNVEDMSNMFEDTDVSTENMDSMLVSWSGLEYEISVDGDNFASGVSYTEESSIFELQDEGWEIGTDDFGEFDTETVSTYEGSTIVHISEDEENVEFTRDGVELSEGESSGSVTIDTFAESIVLDVEIEGDASLSSNDLFIDGEEIEITESGEYTTVTHGTSAQLELEANSDVRVNSVEYEEPIEIPSYIVEQDVTGSVEVSTDVFQDYYYNDGSVSFVHATWALIDATNDEVIDQGDWEDVGEVLSEPDEATITSASYEHTFDQSFSSEGEYSFVTMIIQSTTEAQAEADEDGYFEQFEWEDYEHEEVARNSKEFVVVSASEPEGVLDSLSDFFSNIVDSIVDTLVDVFEDGELQMPNLGEPQEINTVN